MLKAVMMGPSGALVLISDDDPVTRAVVRAWLVDAGYAVIAAADGDAALAVAVEERPDLLLVDVSMPGMDGFELCRALQQAVALAPPVIFLTAHTDTHARVTGLEAGAVDYIVKPFNRDELVARVRAALRTKAVRDDLVNHATLDVLTGLPNRRDLDARAGTAIAHAQRFGSPLSCAMIDVDHFKRINDRHGHAAGDAVLREAAERLRATRRATDTIARYGGEEFVVLLPETTAENAGTAAERYRRAFSQKPFIVDDVELHITASVGVAIWTQGIIAPASLYAAADRALYQAKDSGRNRAEMLGSA